LHCLFESSSRVDTCHVNIANTWRNLSKDSGVACLDFPRFSGQVEVCVLKLLQWCTSVQS
jgi:hypothetical protein